MKKIILYILPVIILTSCMSKIFPDPYLFILNEEIQDVTPIYGKIMSHLSSVEVTGINEIEVYPGGRFALASAMMTHLNADFTVEIMEGEGLRFAFRSASHNYDIHPKVVFDYTTSGCTVKENNTILTTVDSIKADLNKRFRVKIDNNGSFFNITVDCDTVYKGHTSIPMSEYVVVETLESSAARLSGINFEEYVETNKDKNLLIYGE